MSELSIEPKALAHHLWKAATDVFIPSSGGSRQDQLLLWKERLFVAFWLSTMTLTLLVVFPSVSLAMEEGRWPVVFMDTIAYAAGWALLLFRRSISFTVRSVLTSSLVLAVALVIIVSLGP